MLTISPPSSIKVATMPTPAKSWGRGSRSITTPQNASAASRISKAIRNRRSLAAARRWTLTNAASTATP
ncbi:MAG TPA: hypothetical protein VF184_00925, partial [Phycisphaeraceae bacterium]